MPTESLSAGGVPIQAVLLIAFGGPNAPPDIRPFLANVARGRPIPHERLEEVAHHYERIGGKSPLTELTRRQARALEQELARRGCALPVYVGMRNWRPFLTDTLQEMVQAGVKRAIGFIMAAYRSDASWDRYQRDVAEARQQVGPAAPEIDYIEPYYNHPGFIEAVTHQVQTARDRLSPEQRQQAVIVFTAHSIPQAMAESSTYVEQLTEACRLVAHRLGVRRTSAKEGVAPWRLAYQSRSGSPQVPWLGPDILDLLEELAAQGTPAAIVVPIGFLCDHVEVLYDLDVEAAEKCRELGIVMVRARTVNDDPRFIRTMADIVEARIRQWTGQCTPSQPPGGQPGPAC